MREEQRGSRERTEKKWSNLEMRETNRLKTGPAYLEREFRNLLFCKAYEKAGSLRGIAAEIGYTVKPGVNGVVRDMWKGTKGMPMLRLQALAEFAKVSGKKVQRNLVSKANNELLEDWASEFSRYRITRNARNSKSEAEYG